MKKAKAKLKLFLGAYLRSNYREMYEHSQITWKESGNVDKIWELYSPFSLYDYKITDHKIVERGLMVDFHVSVLIGGEMINGKNVGGKWSKGKVRLVCEQEPFKPSKDGQWGVNPVSAINLLHEAILP